VTVCRGLFERYFLSGIKRVCLNYPNFEKFEYMKTNYPYIDHNLFPALRPGILLFFQNEQLKRQTIETYLQNADQIQPDSYEYHKVLGTILEFPPKAVEFFASGRNETEPSIGIHFCGTSFSSSVDDITENVAWMWNHFPYPEDDILMLRHQMDFVEIPFKDFDMLEEIEKNIIKAKEAGQI
jgi:hypothetical protein